MKIATMENIILEKYLKVEATDKNCLGTIKCYHSTIENNQFCQLFFQRGRKSMVLNIFEIKQTVAYIICGKCFIQKIS